MRTETQSLNDICTGILASGPRVGQRCNRKVSEIHGNYCNIHRLYDPNVVCRELVLGQDGLDHKCCATAKVKYMGKFYCKTCYVKVDGAPKVAARLL